MDTSGYNSTLQGQLVSNPSPLPQATGCLGFESLLRRGEGTSIQ